ncbi:MAG: exopolyphosphatase [Candidatus Anammoxibacter sp.]
MTRKKKYRLVTKGDFDGLVSAVLLKYLDMIDDIIFVLPKDVEAGKVEITGNDITSGLPYVESAHMAFDNYPGSAKNVKGQKKNRVIDAKAPSTTRVIYKHFGGKKKFPLISEEMLAEVDKGYSARYITDEILYPSNWGLLNYLIDQRTGLEKFKKFRISHYQLMMDLVDYCKQHTILEILSLPDVEERLHAYFSAVEQYEGQLLRCSTIYYNVVVADMRKEKFIYPGNRFIIYALFPECNVSLQVVSDSNNKTVFVVGKSIIDRSYKPHIGKIMSEHGGGGHANAGTCQVNNDKANKVLEELIGRLKYGLLKNLFLGYFN